MEKYKKRYLQVAIDSPAAAGAGTQAKLISKHYNLFYLDSGKIYRLLAYLKIKNPNKFSYSFISKKMRVLKPKYILVLIWSFRSEIIKQELNYIKEGGNLIFHLPKFHIVNKENYKNFINKDFKNFSYKY